MFNRGKIHTTYEVDRVIQPIYTGGAVGLDGRGRILATCLGEEAVLTDLKNGESLARVEGVSDFRKCMLLAKVLTHC